MRVAIVMPGNITDKSWNQAGYEGLMRAKEELGIEVAFSEKVAQPDQAEALADYARRGYEIVIGHGGEFQEAANRVASRHPETMFVVNNGTEPAENLATADFYYRQFGYLLGYLGGKMSETGKGGFIGAQKIKFSTDLQESFVEGFKAARADGEVFVAWTNDWDDIAKGKEAALNQINQGADVIFPTMDNAAIGSLQAAKDNGVWAFGLYYDAHRGLARHGPAVGHLRHPQCHGVLSRAGQGGRARRAELQVQPQHARGGASGQLPLGDPGRAREGDRGSGRQDEAGRARALIHEPRAPARSGPARAFGPLSWTTSSSTGSPRRSAPSRRSIASP